MNHLPINVVNKRTYKGKFGHYIGRPSALGNPYTSKDYGGGIKVESVSEAIRLYEIWLREQIKLGNRAVINELNDIYYKSENEGCVDLVCWCWPRPCHGNVIVKVITEFVNNQGK